MNLWFGKAAFILGFFAIGHFRDPHAKRNKKIKVLDNRKSKFDIGLIISCAIGGTLLPVIWMIFDIFKFADYPLYPASFLVGVLLLISGLWLFNRSHLDLGTNWSVSLELRENHSLVTHGLYKKIRHPMYASLLLYYIAEPFLITNWIIGPLGFITLAVLYFCRVQSEEKMMLDQFGDQYRAYMKASKRLIPGIY
jgi:protein-S-isoprenylcysteine O-methyltransferase Ste14